MGSRRDTAHRGHVLITLAGTLCVLPACASDDDSAPADDEADAAAPDGSPDTDAAPSSPECADEASASSCRACIHQGLVQGGSEETMCEYLGIPYAKPPVGERRFAAPEPAEGWSGVRQATEYGPACMQGQGLLSGMSGLSEDCLFINVWTPAEEPAEPLPVMVYVHGGGYTSGATDSYSGFDLSRAGNVVVVSMGYRVGALGFFAHPDLDAERSAAPSGSDAIRDQQLALEWVKDNIASFQGDPRNVTLFGESAGSSSVGVHLVSPRSRGLAKRFIMESGVSTRGVANGIAPIPRAEMYAQTEQMAEDLCPGASDAIECLRGLPADQLIQWSPGGGAGANLEWAPVIEGEGGVLPDSPDALMERDEFEPGEIIVGTNKNEYALFALLRGSVASLEEMRARVEASYPDSVDDIMALYAPDDSVDANQAYTALMTDVMFRCATRRFARLAAAKGRSVYLYSFDQGTAMHSDELGYVFGAGYFTLGIAEPVQSLQEAIRGYWFNFAREGDPNGDGLPVWPEYDEASDEHMILVDPPSVGENLQKDACDFWDDYLANQ